MDFEIEDQDEGWAEVFRQECQAEAERPALFWAAQRAQIRSEIAAQQRRFSLRLALASTAALFVVAGAMVAGAPAPAPVTEASPGNISDQQLLADIDETLTNPVPHALAPADLLAQDMDRSLSASGKKETR